MTDLDRFEEWAIVDIFGHDRYVGRVSEQTIGGAAFVRVDVPTCGNLPAFSKLFGASAIYSITPVDETTAKQMALDARKTPFDVWNIREIVDREIEQRKLKPAIANTPDDDDFDDVVDDVPDET